MKGSQCVHHTPHRLTALLFFSVVSRYHHQLVHRWHHSWCQRVRLPCSLLICLSVSRSLTVVCNERRWSQGWKAKRQATPLEVIDAVVGLYCLERAGLSPPFKDEIIGATRSTGASRKKGGKTRSTKVRAAGGCCRNFFLVQLPN